ncbi:MAG TPA: thioredoxin family protein, partial [Verrucomicrobiae bacterium]
WQAKVPRPAGAVHVEGFWQKAPVAEQRPLLIQADWPAPGAKVPHQLMDFYPFGSDDFEVQPEVKIVLDSTGELELTKQVKKFSGEWPKQLSGVLVVDNAAYEVKFEITDMSAAAAMPGATAESAAPTVPATSAATGNNPPVNLGMMLLYAFIGGLILNIMPCVLPVIALKILGFVSEARSDARHVRRLGLIYTFGVLLSFLSLAALILGVKAAGHHAGWGMQFGNPIFLVFLTTLVTLVALNLFGVFEVTIGGGAMDKAGALASQSGAAGAFFNGVLATVLATPCTAPFLSIALGFAFTQPGYVLVLIFLMVGIGLASPYLILSWNPGWLKFLPKPGAWMEKFKMAMGFPMVLTVLWLLNVASSSYDKKVVWLGVWLVFVATAAWVFGEFSQRGRRGRSAAVVVALIILGAGYGFALEHQLQWRQPVITDKNSVSEISTNGFWQAKAWSPEAVQAARAAGHPVLVDFTADWCLTCRVNAETSIEISAVSNKLQSINGVAFRADYTHFPDNITAELNRFNRAGVPLVLVFPKDPQAPPRVLPEVLTPDIVLNNLDAASK